MGGVIDLRLLVLEITVLSLETRDASPDDFVGRGFPVFRTGTSIAC